MSVGQQITSWSIVCLLILFFVGVGGCGGQNSSSETSVPVTPPSTFEDSGQTWTIKEITPQDEHLLGGYFRQNASLADNPLIDGMPLLYRSSSKATRFYWAETILGEVQWVRIDSQGSRFIGLEQGKGFPFETPSSK